MELATAGSTRPITQTVTHAGIVVTTVYELREPTIRSEWPRFRLKRRKACLSKPAAFFWGRNRFAEATKPF